jgi:hypothetical protein
MTFSKNSTPNTSTPSVVEQLRMQRLLEQESRSSASDNAAEESDSLSFIALPSFTAASAQLRMQRHLSPSGLGSSTAAPRGSHRTSFSMEYLRSILTRAVEVLDEVLDEDDEEVEDTVVSSRRDDSNSQP